MADRNQLPVVTSRGDFEKLIALRMKEAKHLLQKKDWDGAYYLAGYVIEYALKICIIGRVMKSESFPTRNLFDGFYTHSLVKLRDVAGLKDEMASDDSVKEYWETVKDWNEQSRYEIGRSPADATDLYNAIKIGVLPWIKARW